MDGVGGFINDQNVNQYSIALALFHSKAFSLDRRAKWICDEMDMGDRRGFLDVS